MTEIIDEAAMADATRHGGNIDVEHTATGWRRWALPAATGASLLAAGVVALVNHHHSSAADAAEEARKVGTTHVEELLAYRHTTLAAELADEKKWLTDDFAKTYSGLVNDRVAPAAAKAKVTTTAAVVAAGVEDASDDEVTLLLFVNVVTNSSELRAPRVTGGRLEVSMEHVDGHWLIDALDPI